MFEKHIEYSLCGAIQFSKRKSRKSIHAKQPKAYNPAPPIVYSLAPKSRKPTLPKSVESRPPDLIGGWVGWVTADDIFFPKVVLKRTEHSDGKAINRTPKDMQRIQEEMSTGFKMEKLTQEELDTMQTAGSSAGCSIEDFLDANAPEAAAKLKAKHMEKGKEGPESKGVTQSFPDEQIKQKRASRLLKHRGTNCTANFISHS